MSSLRTNVILHLTRITNRILIDARVPHLNKEADPTGKKRIVGMMEVVRLTAFDKIHRLSKVMGHTRLNGYDFGPLFSIASLKKRLCEFHHLRGLDELTGDEALHRPFRHTASKQVIKFLVANKMRIMKASPVTGPLASNSLIDQEFIGLALIRLAINQRLILQAIVFDIGTRDNVVDLIQAGIRELIDIDRPSGVKALTTLHEIQRESLVQIRRRRLLYLIPDFRVILFESFEGFPKLVVTALRALPLRLPVLISSDLDKDVRGSMARDSRNLVNDSYSLIQASTDCRRTRQVIHAHISAMVGVISTIHLVDGLLEAKVFIPQGLHHHHRLTVSTG